MKVIPSGAYQAAIVVAGVGASQPDLKVELLNYAVATSGWQQLGGVAGTTGRNHCIVAADGGLVQAYVDAGSPNANVYVRRIAPGNLLYLFPTFGAAVYTTAQTTAGVNIAVMSDRLRLLFQDSGSNKLRYVDSFNNGATWGSVTDLVTLGGQCYGIAGDYNSVLFAAYVVGAHSYTVVTIIGGSIGAAWSAGNVYGLGPGCITARNNGTTYTVVAAVATAPAVGFTSGGVQLVVTTYITGTGGWGSVPYTVLQVVDSPNGTINLSAPHLDYWATPGVSGAPPSYRLCYVRSDTGTYTGTAYTHLATCWSIDALHWTEALEVVLYPSTYGGCWVDGVVASFLLSSDTVLYCVPFDGSGATPTHYRDCSSDVLRYERIQVDGAPAEVVVTLDNASGQYSAAAATPLVVNAVLRVSEGYVLAGAVQGQAGNTLYTGVLYLDSWTYERSADSSEVTLTGRDGRKSLDRESRYPLTYTGQTLAWLITEMAARGGYVWVVQEGTPLTLQMTQVVTTYTVPVGETWEKALIRLGELMGFSFQMVPTVTGGPFPGGTASAAQAGLEVLLYKEMNANTDAAIWSYSVEPESFELLVNDERANHVLAYGLTLPAVGTFPAQIVGGEAWDAFNVAATGQERYAYVSDKMLTTVTMAAIRAGNDLLADQRTAWAGELVVPHNPLLELWDVLLVSDSVVCPGGQLLRVAGLHYHYDPTKAVNDLMLTLEGV